ncbi:MAG: EamA family transporter [Cyclobacteriaceae bacterium]|nr:EamA family transporter [Cyclobacteriaceae bacterium]
MRLPNIILFLIPTLIWGSTWYIIKFQIGGTDPLYSVGYRFTLAGIILILYSKINNLNLSFSPRKHFFIALQGACLFGINYWLIYMAEEHLTSGLVAVIFSGLIFMNVFLNSLILKAPIRVNVIIGGAIGLVGIFLIFKDELSAFNLSDNNFVAFLMAFGSVTLASAGNILSAYNQKQKVPVIQTNAFGMLYGSMVVIAIALFSGKSVSFDMNFSYISSLLYLTVFGSVIAFSTYLSLLGRIGPDKAGYFALVIPVIALFISTFLEGYQWTFYGISGLLLILGGIFMALQKK